MARKLILAGLLATLLTAVVAAPLTGRASAASPVIHVAGAPLTRPAFLDKTRFLLHMGAAYFAFHHWVWTPYKAHKFDSGAKGRTTAIIKGGVATLFAYHELKVSYDIAKKSNSATLHAIIKPLDALVAAANSLGNSLKSGNFQPSAVNSFSGAADSIARSVGGIKDVSAPIPGL
jgi:hypothetical protein